MIAIEKVPVILPVEIVYLIGEYINWKLNVWDLLNLALISKSFAVVFTKQVYWDKLNITSRTPFILRSLSSPLSIHVRGHLQPLRLEATVPALRLPSEIWNHPLLLFRLIEAIPEFHCFPSCEDILLIRNDTELLVKLTLKGYCYSIDQIFPLFPLVLRENVEYCRALWSRYSIWDLESMELRPHVSRELLRNRMVARMLVMQDSTNFVHLPSELVNDLAFLMDLALANPGVVRHFGELRHSVNFMAELVRQNPYAARYACGAVQEFIESLDSTIQFEEPWPRECRRISFRAFLCYKETNRYIFI